MNYLIFDAEINATDRNRDITMYQACGLQPGDVTTYWFGMIQHPLTGQFALVVPDDQTGLLTVAEQAALLTQQDAEAADWFLSFEEEV